MNIKDYLKQHPGSLNTVELYHKLDSVNYEERDLVFAELLKRVEIGGFVYIKGIDIHELCRYVASGHIPSPEKEFSKYKSLSSINLIYNQLSSIGFQVLVSEKNGIEYYVVGKRNA